MFSVVRRLVPSGLGSSGSSIFASRHAQSCLGSACASSRWMSTSVTESPVSSTDEGNVDENGKKKHIKILKKHDRPIIKKLRAHNAEHEEKAAALGLEWRIVSSTILHRYPVISRDPEQWELDMGKLEEDITEKKREWFHKQVGETSPANLIGTANPSYEEIVAMLPFEPASRVTEADRTNDTRSKDRRLQDSAFLIVKRNREHYAWQFPQGKINFDKDGDNARSAAERIIDRAVGKINRWFVSNSPCGHICYPYSSEMQQQRKQYGAKVYFYRCQLIAGTIKLETRLYTDYAWVTRDEISKYMDDKLTGEFLEAVLPY